MALSLIFAFIAIAIAGGVAVSYVAGSAAVLAFIAAGYGNYLAIMPQRIFSQIDVFTFLSMPLFILAGELMTRGGVTRALIDLAMLMVGRLKGGLGYVNISASVFLAGVSGSAVADAAATRSRIPLGSIAPGTPGSVTINRYDVGVGVSSFELDFWGRIANLSEAARAQYLAAEANQRAFYLSLIADVATTYFALLESEAQIDLAQATLESRQEGLRIARLRLDAGVTSALPFRQSETLLTTAEQQLAAQRLSQAQQRNQLSVLVGGTTPENLPVALPMSGQENGMELDPGTPSDLLLVRPDIVAAEEQLRAARANIGAARAAFFPTISLTGNAGFSSNSLDGLFSSDGLGWSFGPSISLPIFDRGGREADLDLAKALEVEQVANYDRTVQTAFREVSDSLAGRRYLAEQVETLERGVEAQERIARLARLRYREGVADYLEVLDAERNLFSARQQLLATERAWLQNRATLFVALGGGDDR